MGSEQRFGDSALKVSVGMEQILTLARGWRVDFAPKMLAEDLLLSFYTVQTVVIFFFYTVGTGNHTIRGHL